MHSPHSQRLLGSSAARCRARRALSTLEYPRVPIHALVRATAQRTRRAPDVQIRQRSMTRTGLTQLPKYSRPASSTLSTHAVPRSPCMAPRLPFHLHIPRAYLHARTRTHACLRTRAHTHMHRRTNTRAHVRTSAGAHVTRLLCSGSLRNGSIGALGPYSLGHTGGPT